MQNKKQLIWGIIAVALAGLTIKTVFSQSDGLSLSTLSMLLKGANIYWLIPAVLCMLGFIYFEGEAILCIIRHIGYKKNAGRGFLYSAADIFFSSITPSASGGQPASAFFMMKDGIPGSTVTVVLILNLIMYTLAILTLGAVVFIFRPAVFMHFGTLSKVLIIAGYVMLIFLAILFFMLLEKGEILLTLGNKLFSLLHRLHLMKRPEARREKLKKSIQNYKQCVNIMNGQKKMLLYTYIFNLLQRASQIAVTPLMYMATGGKLEHWRDLFATQTMVTIGSNCVPIPGAMGAADYLMVNGFRGMFSRDYAFQLEFLSRSLSFYICIIISAVTVLIGYFVLRKRDMQS